MIISRADVIDKVNSYLSKDLSREQLEQWTSDGQSGKKVTSQKQATAIGLSKARKKGAKAPKKSDGGS